MGIGALAYKLKMVEDNFVNQATRLCIEVFIPCAILRSFRTDLTSDLLHESLYLIIMGGVAILASFVIAFIFVHIFKPDILTANICYLAIIYSNFGIVGFSMVEQVFGAMGLIYFSMFGIFIRFTHYTFGFLLMQRGCGEGGKTNWLQALFCPPMIAVGAALALLFLHISLPPIVNTTVDLLASCLSPMGVLILGVILARYPFRTLFSDKLVFMISFLRLVGIPVAAAFALKALGFSGAVAGVPVLILALPAANNCTLLAERYGGNVRFGAQVVFVSTLFSIVTIPLVLLLTSHIL